MGFVSLMIGLGKWAFLLIVLLSRQSQPFLYKNFLPGAKTDKSPTEKQLFLTSIPKAIGNKREELSKSLQNFMPQLNLTLLGAMVRWVFSTQPHQATTSRHAENTGSMLLLAKVPTACFTKHFCSMYYVVLLWYS